MRFPSLLLALAAATLLTGCDKPSHRALAPHLRAWLPEPDGAVVRFRNAAGQVHDLRVTVRQTKEDAHGSKAGPDFDTYERYAVAYVSQQRDSLRCLLVGITDLQVSFSDYDGDFRQAFAPDLSLMPHADPAHEQITSSEFDETTLRSDEQLRGHTYPRLLVARDTTTARTGTPALIRACTYSKTDGLLDFTTRDGQLWVRQ